MFVTSPGTVAARDVPGARYEDHSASEKLWHNVIVQDDVWWLNGEGVTQSRIIRLFATLRID